MTLEDHAGDVVRKARMMLGVPAADSAAAARISAEALESFENAGTVPEGVDWKAWGQRLDLHPEKLRRFASGWSPAEIDTTLWLEVRQITTHGDGMSVNCYLVWDPVSREAALFDTGFDAAPIFTLMDEHRLQLTHLFITHTHGDHVAALEPVRARVPAAALHTNAAGAPPQHRNRPGDCIHVGSLRVTHQDTPGHADDGVTYIVQGFAGDAPPVAIVGDAIFAGSIGGAPGKGPLARGKIRDHILSLPPGTLICPGHGPLTTVGEQALVNPFFS